MGAVKTGIGFVSLNFSQSQIPSLLVFSWTGKAAVDGLNGETTYCGISFKERDKMVRLDHCTLHTKVKKKTFLKIFIPVNNCM